MFNKRKAFLQEIVIVDFTTVNKELLRFKTHISSVDCPACKQKTLKLDKYEQGPEGWLAVLSCQNCNFQGQMSDKGFSFTEISSKGKAVDKK
ncbi:hypothetical protein MUP79_01685 [Candidatus Bathyarchaeota archaeon]|nr:hypothetical protein [Candidatus Bathyarchaeota archaeon]